ncbi:MAG: FMN-binding protein [Gammaproteobacteria bacterium]
MTKPALAVLGFSLASAACVAGDYRSPEAFLGDAFGTVPPPAVIWFTPDIRADMERILSHPPAGARQRYWLRDGRSAWILDEIGKVQPITVGVVIDAGTVERTEVLAFREERGWEVRYPFFLEQFRGVRLRADRNLDRPIDGISGATLSVRALQKVVRLALYLDSARRSQDERRTDAPR